MVSRATAEHDNVAKHVLLLFVALLMGTGAGVILSVWDLLNPFLTDTVAGKDGLTFELFHGHLDSRQIGAFSYREIRRLSDTRQLPVQIAAYSPVPVTISSRSWQQRIRARFVTNSYSRLTNATFAIGQNFSCDTDLQPCSQAVLAFNLWRQRFGADSTIIGRSILVNGREFTVCGVRLTHDYIGRIDGQPELWLPLQAAPELLGFNWIADSNDARWLLPIVRLHPPVSQHQAEERIETLLSAEKSVDGEQSGFLLLTPGQASLARVLRIRGTLVTLLTGHLRFFLLGLIFLWLMALSCLTASRLHKQLSFTTITILTVACIGTILAASTLVRVVLVSFLIHFGAPLIAASHFNWRPIGLTASMTFAAMVAINGWQRLWSDRQPQSRPAIAPRRSTFRKFTQLITILGRQRIIIDRYVVLCGGLILLELGFISNGLFGGDLYHHAAVVRELAIHPLHPQHPILPILAPHAGYSPYTLLVAWASRLSGLSPVDALRAFGLLNLLILFWTLRLFVRKVFSGRHADFYALLFILILWGFSPWMTSGFLHLNYLVQGAAYPSTFATALLFLSWYIAVLLASGGTNWLLLPLIAIIFAALLDHPITAGSLIIGLFAVTFDYSRSWFALFRLAGACAVALSLVWLWPYYPFYSLVFGNSSNIDAVVSHLYPGPKTILLMTFPALVGLPLLWLRFKANRRDFLTTIFACSLAIYLFGAISGKYVVGRVIYFMILALQLGVADWLSRREDALSTSSSNHRAWRARYAVLGSAALGGLMMLPGLMTCLPVFQNSYGEYSFLSSRIKPNTVILSDFDTSLKLPAFGAKVVSYAPEHSLFFVDTRSREHDVRRFFSDVTPQSERLQILRRYHVSFVLLNRQKVANWPSILESLSTTTSASYADGTIFLLTVGSLNKSQRYPVEHLQQDAENASRRLAGLHRRCCSAARHLP